jgi:hypothetical protein
MPRTLWSLPAKYRAFSPVPQTASRTAPVTRSAIWMNDRYGLPMSQGAFPAWIDSKVSRLGMVLMVILLPLPDGQRSSILSQ